MESIGKAGDWTDKQSLEPIIAYIKEKRTCIYSNIYLILLFQASLNIDYASEVVSSVSDVPVNDGAKTARQRLHGVTVKNSDICILAGLYAAHAL